MKKLIAALAACLIIVSAFASCSDPLSSSNNSDTNSSSSKTSSSTSSKKSSSPKKAKTYEDNFDGLEDYMTDKGYLTDEIIKKANDTKLPKVDGVDYTYGYEYIGAETGKKYTNNGVLIELYAFKEGEKNEFIDSVKKNGTFTLFDAEVKAYLTSDDKYMMVYTDKNVKEGDTESDAYKTMQTTIKDFEAFSPTKETKDDEKETASSKASDTTTSETKKAS